MQTGIYNGRSQIAYSYGCYGYTRGGGATWHGGLAHTKDPARAKPWVDAYGTSGMYMVGECYLAKDGKVYRCLQDNCVWDADGLPSAWEKVQQ